MKVFSLICLTLVLSTEESSQKATLIEYFRCTNSHCTVTEFIELSSAGTFKIKEGGDAPAARIRRSSGTWVASRDTLSLRTKNGPSLTYLYRTAISRTFLVNPAIVGQWATISADLEIALKSSDYEKKLEEYGPMSEDAKNRLRGRLSQGIAQDVLYEKPSVPYDIYILNEKP